MTLHASRRVAYVSIGVECAVDLVVTQTYTKARIFVIELHPLDAGVIWVYQSIWNFAIAINAQTMDIDVRFCFRWKYSHVNHTFDVVLWHRHVFVIKMQFLHLCTKKLFCKIKGLF